MRIERYKRLPLMLAVFAMTLAGCAQWRGDDAGRTSLLGLASASDEIGGFELASGPGDEHPAAQAIRALGEEAIALLSDPALDEATRFERFRDLMVRGVAVEPIAQFVLGRYWRRATEAQREAYLTVYSEFIIASFTRKLGGVSISRFEVVGVSPTKQGGQLVETVVARDGGEPIRAIWRLRESDGEWRIIDLMVEGISLAMTQRQEFASVIRGAGGIDGLISRLREMTAAAA